MNLLNIDNYFMIKKNIEREFNYAASIFGTINLKNGTITKIFQKYYYYSSFWLTKFFKSTEIYRESYVCDYYSIGFENFGGKMSNFKFILRKINIPILI